VQQDVAEPADEAVALAEGKRVAEQRPGHGDRAEGTDTHHERVERVLGAHQAGVEEAKRRSHHQDQRRGDEHPGGGM
jgi:hypothetical protein